MDLRAGVLKGVLAAGKTDLFRPKWSLREVALKALLCNLKKRSASDSEKSMPTAKANWSLPQINRKAYFVCAGLLTLVTALLPISFLFVGGPAGWLLLFTARVRDIGKQVWMWPVLSLVGAEMFGREIARYLGSYFNALVAGYFIAALILVHIIFAIALGFQRSGTQKALA